MVISIVNHVVYTNPVTKVPASLPNLLELMRGVWKSPKPTSASPAPSSPDSHSTDISRIIEADKAAFRAEQNYQKYKFFYDKIENLKVKPSGQKWSVERGAKAIAKFLGRWYLVIGNRVVQDWDAGHAAGVQGGDHG